MLRIVVAGLLLWGLCGWRPACRGQAPAWETAIPFEVRDRPEDHVKVQLAVRREVDAVLADTVERGDKVGRAAVRALALMQALQELRYYQLPANNYLSAEERAVFGGDEMRFKNARLTALKCLQEEVLPKTMPEFWESIKPGASADPDQLPPQTDRKTVADVRAVIGGGHDNYAAAVIVMAVEFYLNGGTSVTWSDKLAPRDRAPASRVRVPKRAQLGVARLVALMLSAGPGAQWDAKPDAGCLWEYTTFGAKGNAYKTSCFSKSGTVAMGLNAALTNLNLLDFDKGAFEFTAGQLLSRELFLERLSDVLVHCVLGIVRIRADSTDVTESLGVLGLEGYKRLDPKRWEKLAGKAFFDVVDTTKYRTVHATDEQGRRLIGVQKTTAGDVGLPAGVPPVASYRYLPHTESYGAYHSASAAYLLLVATRNLETLLESTPGGLGKYYAIKRSGDHWELDDNGTKRVLRLEPLKAGRLTRLTVEGLDPNDRVIDHRIGQVVNFVVAALTRPDGGRRVLHRAGFDATFESWEMTLSLEPVVHGKMMRGMDLFGILKLGLALGQPDCLGPWFYHRDFCAVLADTKFVVDNAWCHHEFAILVLTRSYRNLFGRDTD
jgi:hypothetical protein